MILHALVVTTLPCLALACAFSQALPSRDVPSCGGPGNISSRQQGWHQSSGRRQFAQVGANFAVSFAVKGREWSPPNPSILPTPAMPSAIPKLLREILIKYHFVALVGYYVNKNSIKIYFAGSLESVLFFVHIIRCGSSSSLPVVAQEAFRIVCYTGHLAGCLLSCKERLLFWFGLFFFCRNFALVVLEVY